LATTWFCMSTTSSAAFGRFGNVGMGTPRRAMARG
jgi:hypothetical protein